MLDAGSTGLVVVEELGGSVCPSVKFFGWDDHDGDLGVSLIEQYNCVVFW